MRRVALATVAFLAVAHAAAADEIRPTLDKFKETRVARLGYRETSRPFSFVGPDGKPIGYSIDLCQQVVAGVRQSQKLSELKIEWVPVTPGDRIPSLVKGAIDLECGSTTITFSRMEQVAFSHMIFVDGGGLLATAASGVTTVKDLAGKRVGVIPSTTTEKWLTAALAAASIRATVVPVKTIGEGLQGLEGGRFDAYASDRLVLGALTTTARDPATLRLSPEMFSYEPYALMLRRGDNAFQASVNRALSHLYRDGTSTCEPVSRAC